MEANRSKLQFGLGSLFILTAVVAIGLAAIPWVVIENFALIALGLFAMLIPMTMVLLVIDRTARAIRFLAKCLRLARPKAVRF